MALGILCSCAKQSKSVCWSAIHPHTFFSPSPTMQQLSNWVGRSLRTVMSTKPRKNAGQSFGHRLTLQDAPESCIKPTNSGTCSMPCGQRTQIVLWYLMTLGISRDSLAAMENHSTQSLRCFCERVALVELQCVC